MPYNKPVKDSEAAIAEAITTEIAFLTAVNHPADDKPEIVIQKNVDTLKDEVVLPKFRMETSLSDMMIDAIDGIPINYNDVFLKSLGEVIAFSWYTGQGDLNATNVSVCDGRCYPFDFDCCFQSKQSATSFAKTRIPTFASIDLDTLETDNEIIVSALNNLKSSIETTLPGTGDSLSPLFTSEKIAIIRKGFHEQLHKIASIHATTITSLVKKYGLGSEQEKAYLDYLAVKNQKTKDMIVSLTGAIKDGVPHSTVPQVDPAHDVRTMRDAIADIRKKVLADDETVDDKGKLT